MKKVVFASIILISTLFCGCKQNRGQVYLDKYLHNDSVAQLLLVEYLSGSDAVAGFYIKEDGKWLLLEEGPVFVGKNGLGKEKEGDMKTPIGEFTVATAFGILPNPGTALPYIDATPSIYGCDDDPRYYNTIIDTAVVHHECHGEHLMDYVPHYHYGMTISYNEEQVMGLGSCIFVHCKGPNPYTAGCVALDESFMRTVLVHADSRIRVCIY